MKSLVIIPAYNEEKNIRSVIARIREHNPGSDILVVNDQSSDRTAAFAREAGAFVVSHVLNGGYGTGLQTGYKFALRNNYDMVAQIDGDGQHDPSHVKELFSKIVDEGYDFVIGSRFLGDMRKYNMPILRKIGMRFFQSLIYLFTGKRFSDPTSGYQALSRNVFQFFAQGNVFPNDYPDADVIVLLHYAGFKITEIPVVMYENETGQSMHSGFKPIYYVIKMLLSLFIVRVNKRKERIAYAFEG